MSLIVDKNAVKATSLEYSHNSTNYKTSEKRKNKTPNRSIVSKLISVLVFIRILPRGPGSFFGWYGTLLWSIWAFVLSAHYIQYSWESRLKKEYKENQNIARGIIILASNWLPSFQVCLGFPALAYFIYFNRHLTEIKKPPRPRHWWLLVAWFVYAFICIVTEMDIIVRNDDKATIVLTSIHNFFNFISTSICLLLTGVSVQNSIAFFEKTFNGMDCKKAEQVTCEVINEYAALKKGLSPLLFILLSPTVGSLILYTYIASLEFSSEKWVLAFILRLTYICLITDNCHKAFSSLPYKLRLDLIGATKEEQAVLKDCIYKLKVQAPFEALGFFQVGWRTLTDIANLVIVYLVIMVRFYY